METYEEFDSDDELFNEDDIMDIEKETEQYKDFFYTNTENISIKCFILIEIMNCFVIKVYHVK